MAKTWSQLKDEIKDDMNLQGEDFVSDSELLAWANDGIEQAEKEIVSLYDKYFETDAFIALVTGTNLYNLPTNILANKITHIEYKSGNKQYEVKYLKRKNEVRYLDDNFDFYRYRLRNDSTNGQQIELFPASLETSSQNLKVHYIRSVNRLVDDTDTIEIPIADAFIKEYIKDQVRAKELGPMFQGQETSNLARQRALMIEALNNMIPDDSRDEILPDTRHYDDIYDDFEMN
jgi:hypothetical protein